MPSLPARAVLRACQSVAAGAAAEVAAAGRVAPSAAEARGASGPTHSARVAPRARDQRAGFFTERAPWEVPSGKRVTRAGRCDGCVTLGVSLLTEADKSYFGRTNAPTAHSPVCRSVGCPVGGVLLARLHPRRLARHLRVVRR